MKQMKSFQGERKLTIKPFNNLQGQDLSMQKMCRLWYKLCQQFT